VITHWNALALRLFVVASAIVTLLACGGPETDPEDAGATGPEDAGTTAPCGDGGLRAWYPDRDGDGFGAAAAVAVSACDAPEGHVDNALDCDDASASVRPGAPELCNGVDDDCDPSTSDIGLVTFRDEVTGEVSDLTARFAAPPGRASIVTLDRAGTVWICGPAELRASFLIDATPMRIIGEGAVIDAMGMGPVVRIEPTGGGVVELTGVTLRNGEGATPLGGVITARAGGGILCEGGGPTERHSLALLSVELEGNHAELGGGLFGHWCDVDIRGGRIERNEADGRGGGLAIYDGSVELRSTAVRDNLAGIGGGAYVEGNGRNALQLSETPWSGNSAGIRAGALWVGGMTDARIEDVWMTENRAGVGYGSVECERASVTWRRVLPGMLTGVMAGRGTGPRESVGGAVHVGPGCRFVGESMTISAEAPSTATLDISTEVGRGYMVGGERTFECDSSSCGAPRRSGIGSAGETSVASNLIGVLVEPTTDESIVRLRPYTRGPLGCELWQVVMSAPSRASTEWTVEWARSMPMRGLTWDYYDSGDELGALGLPLRAGRVYALGWSSVGCNAWHAYAGVDRAALPELGDAVAPFFAMVTGPFVPGRTVSGVTTFAGSLFHLQVDGTDL
jgi:hypothetical protein